MDFLELKIEYLKFFFKKSLDGLNSRSQMTEEWFSELEYKSIDNTQSEQRKMIGKKKSTATQWPVGQHEKV